MPFLARGAAWVASIGADDADDDTARAQKATLVLAAAFITVAAVLWVGTYAALGLYLSAAIPFSYQIASIVSLIVLARTHSYRFFRNSQAVLMTSLPFALQWTLGGYVASSAVSLWAFVAAAGTLFFFSAGESIPWFLAFLALTALSGLIDPVVARSPASISDVLRTSFFVFNIAGVATTIYLLVQYAVRARDAALARSDGLLLNVLPRPIADRLKRSPGVIAEHHEDVTVLFADVVDFTPFAEHTTPTRVVSVLDSIFSAFDALAARHGVEKIKTIGDAYMVVAGVPNPRADHVRVMAEMALEMQDAFKSACTALGLDLSIRMGMATGPVVAGVIGRHKFIYDLWGDTVNTASRMELHGQPGRIQVTQTVRQRLGDAYGFEDRGDIQVKGKGQVHAYFLLGRSRAPAPAAQMAKAAVTVT